MQKLISIVHSLLIQADKLRFNEERMVIIARMKITFYLVA